MKKSNALMLCLILLSSFQAGMLNTTSHIHSAIAEETPTFSGEVSDGFFQGAYGINLWYVWLNTSGTHVLFLAMYSEMLPSPINYFIGQHYFTANGTEVFIGNRLLGFEVYEDTNMNSLLDADFTNEFDEASDETRHFFLLNASQTADLKSPSKYTLDNITHYTWGIKYTQTQGNFAQIGNQPNCSIYDPDTEEWLPSSFTEYVSATMQLLNLTFNYWVENDVAYLKTGLEIGEFSGFEIPGLQSIPVTLNLTDRSFSTLYTTSVLSMKPYQISVQNLAETAEARIVNSTSIGIEHKEAFKLVFGEDYTLGDGPGSYKSTAGVYATSSLPGDVVPYAHYFTEDSENLFKEQLKQTSPGLSQNVTVSIRKSSIIYRVCYPTWGNRILSHDPLLVAYLGESSYIPPPSGNGGVSGGTQLPQAWMIATLAGGIAVLLVAVYRHMKIRSYKISTLIRSLLKGFS